MINNDQSGAKDQPDDAVLRGDEVRFFCYRIIHDLKAPLNSMIGLVNLSKTKKLNEPARILIAGLEEYFKQMENEIHSALKGTLSVHDEVLSDAVCFDELLNDIMKLLAHAPEMGSVSIRKTIEQERFFYINRTLVFSILQNIIDNSIKHGKEKEDQAMNISIHVVQTGKSIRITIEDDGKGISENIKSKMFSGPEAKGELLLIKSGLGLYIIRNAVERLKGEINLESGCGKGTKFVITLPEAV